MPKKGCRSGTEGAERNRGRRFRSAAGAEPKWPVLEGSAQVVGTLGLSTGFRERNPTEPSGTQFHCPRAEPKVSPPRGGNHGSAGPLGLEETLHRED